MSTRIFGYRRSGTSTTTADVSVTDYDDSWGLDGINTPIAYQKCWCDQNITIHGENHDIGSSWEDCSNFNTDNTYMAGTLASGLTISSNSIGDCSASGGVHAVRLQYLDVNWTQQTVDVALNGKRPVYVADVLRPQQICAVKVGTSGSAIGDIVLTYSGNKFLKIDAGHVCDHCGYYYIPINKELMITDIFCTPIFGCNTAMDFEFIKQEPETYLGTTYYMDIHRPLGGTVATYTVMNSPTTLVIPYKVKEKCSIRTRVVSNPAGGSGQCVLRGFLVDKPS